MGDKQEVTSGAQSSKMSWEHPWDVDQMRDHAGNWSLASDAGMLLYLRSFSQELLAHTHNLQEQLNEVNRETKLTGVRVNNAFNDFIMLANSQFVENRVYDEDITVDDDTGHDKKDLQEKTQEQREAELIPRITEAVTLGLDIIDTAFQKPDLSKPDTSGDQDNTAPQSKMLLEPKDPYLSRPLPHLIGSVNFMHDDSVGLLEISSDEEEESKKETSSESDQEQEVDDERRANAVQQRPDWSKSQTESESEEDMFTPEQSKMSQGEDIQSNDDESKISSQERSNFLEELSGNLRAPKSTKTTNSKTAIKQTSKTKEDFTSDGDLFSQAQHESPDGDSDDDDPLFKSKSSHFPSGGRLFDDDGDDEGDLFSGTSNKAIHKKADIFVEENSSCDVSSKMSSHTDLFDGDNESDDDLFAAATKSSSTPVTHKQPDLFGEDDEDIFKGSVAKTQPQAAKKKILAGAVSVFGPGINPVVQAIKQHHECRTDESTTESDTESDRYSGSLHDTDTSSSGPVDITSAVTKQPPGGQAKKQGIQVLGIPNARTSKQISEKKEKSPEPSNKSLFDDEDDDLFASVSHKSQSSSKSTKPSAKPSALSLFDDDEDEEDDLFRSISKSKASKKTAAPQETSSSQRVLSLFDDEDDIFSSKSINNEVRKSSTKEAKKSTSRSLSAFDDEDVLFGATNDDLSVDLFGNSSPLKTTSETSKKGTNQPQNDSSITSQSEKTARTVGGVTSKMKKPSRDVDLFLDDGSDSEDLFAIGTESRVNKDMIGDQSKKHSNQGTANINFTNQDLSDNNKATEQSHDSGLTNKHSESSQPICEGLGLFTPAEDDLFNTKTVKAPQMKSAQTTQVQTKMPQTEKTKPQHFHREATLFDDVEEDLFSSTTSSKSEGATSFPKVSVKKTTPSLDTKSLVVDKTVSPETQDKSLENSQSSEDIVDIMASTHPSTKSPPKSKLPGAVSMFGGMDPAALIGHKLKGTSQEVSSMRNQEAGHNDLGGASAHQGPASANQGQASAVIGFHQPTEPVTLSCATKSRVKMSATRRPPSRRRVTQRTAAALDITHEQDISEFFTSTASHVTASTNKPSHTSDMLNHSGILTDVNQGQSGVLTRNLPETNDKISDKITMKSDAISDQSSVQTEKSQSNESETTSIMEDMFAADGLNTVRPNSKQGRIPSFPDPSPSSESSQRSGDLVNHGNDKTPKSTKDHLTNDDDDDFALGIQKRSPQPNVAASILDDTEDIFANSILNKPKSSRNAKVLDDDLFGESKRSKIDDIFAADGDDDDIFGISSKPTQKTIEPVEDIFSSKAKPIKKNKPSTKNDDFDIFASGDSLFEPNLGKEAKAKSTKISESKPAARSVKDHLDSSADVDIFADVPPTTSKSTTAKKHLQTMPDLFNDDDDLFAPKSTTEKTSKVQSSSKRTQKSSRTTTQDIFADDSENIFEDPLLVRRK